jgi:Arc/MetJ-type ribon-helix-helix transcriptional regulator
MTVDIPIEYQAFVTDAIRTGDFCSEAELVAEALRILQKRRERILELRAELGPALARLDRGESVELDDESLDAFFDDIKARG